jgi:hypothetical protein
LAIRSIEAVIPAWATGASVHPVEEAADRRRDAIERVLNRLEKQPGASIRGHCQSKNPTSSSFR